MTVLDIHAPRKNGSAGTEPQLPPEQIEEIRTRLAKHLEENSGFSQAKVAKAIGKTSPVVSQWLKGSYAGNNAAIASSIDRYLGTFERRTSLTGQVTFVRTSIANRIEDAILMAEVARKIAIISTDAGVGASEALRQYRDQNEGVVLLECDPSTVATPWAMLSELLAVVTSNAARLRPSDASRHIIAALSGTDRTILVDEAHYLTNPKVVDLLRRISDRAGVGLVLCGNESTYQGRFGSGSFLSSTAYTQFQRRCVRRMRIKATDIRQADLRLVLSQLLPEAILADVMPRLMTETHLRGGIGRAVSIVQVARVIAKKRPVTSAHIYRAIQVMTEDLDGGEE